MSFAVNTVVTISQGYIAQNTPTIPFGFGSDPFDAHRFYDIDDCVDIRGRKTQYGTILGFDVGSPYAFPSSRWDASKSAYVTTALTVQNVYQVRVWDIMSCSYVVDFYPEQELTKLRTDEDMLTDPATSVDGYSVLPAFMLLRLPVVSAGHYDADALPADVAAIKRAKDIAGGI